MKRIRLAEERDGKLHLQGVIEVPHMPAVGDTFTNSLVKDGKHLKVYAEIAKLINRPNSQPGIHAIAVMRVLKVEEVRPN